MNAKTRTLRLFIYIRVSATSEKKCSPGQQLKGCQRYRKRQAEHGENIVFVGDPVQDLDKSGRDFGKRSLVNLINRVREGEADGILVYRINRWGRDADVCLSYLDELEQGGGVLRSTREVVDTTTSAGRKAIRDAFSDAEYESDVISENWEAAHIDRWDSGRPHIGRDYFGYRHCDECRRTKNNPDAYEACDACDGILIHDHTNRNQEAAELSRAEAMSEAFRRFVDDLEPIRSIAVDMAKRGVRSVRGNVMESTQWYQSMDTGFAAGFIRRKSKELRKKNPKGCKPEDYDVWIEGVHEPLPGVPERWERYKELRAGRQKNPHIGKDTKTGSGLLRCKQIARDGSVCDSVMIHYQSPVKRKNGTRVVYTMFRCRAYSHAGTCKGISVSTTALEREILDWMERWEHGKEVLDDAMQKVTEKRTAGLEDVTRIERQISTLRGRKKSAMAAYDDPDSGMSDDDFQATLRRLNKRINDLEDELVKAKAASVADGPPPPSAFAGLRKEWRAYSEPLRNKALRHIIGRIEISPRVDGERHNRVRIIGAWEPSS